MNIYDIQLTCAVGEVEMAITTLLTCSPPKLSFTAVKPLSV